MVKLNKTFIKYRTKLLFKGTVYDSFADLGEELFKENLLSYKNNTRDVLSSLLSAMISFAKKKHCPFILLENQYVFWAEYEVVCRDPRGAFKISEKPVNKDVKEIYQFYIGRLDNVIGDITISELLQSYKDIFYKLDGLYFKSESNIKKYAYDKTIDKSTMLSLLNDSNYILLCEESYDSLVKSTKKIFYVKNNYIFANKNDYIDRFAIALTKEDVLKELNIIV